MPTTYAHLPALVDENGVMVGYVDANGKERDLQGNMVPPGTTPEPGPAPVEVSWDDVSDKPDFADVATTGEYADLTGAPTIPTALPPTAGSVVNASVGASAAIALSKLANVAAGTDGLAAGTLQVTFQALATRIQALEDATPAP